MEQKNLILAIVLSLAILFGFQFFYETPRLRQQQAAQQATLQAQQTELLAQGGVSALSPTPGIFFPCLSCHASFFSSRGLGSHTRAKLAYAVRRSSL